MHMGRSIKNDSAGRTATPPGLSGRLIGKMLGAIPFRKVDASITNPVAFSGYPDNVVVETYGQFDEVTETLFLSSKPDLISEVIVVESFILNGWYHDSAGLKPGAVPEEGDPVETACIGLIYQLIPICDFRRDGALMFQCVTRGDAAFRGLAGATGIYVVAVKNSDFTPITTC
jgi:hypothetical protein